MTTQADLMKSVYQATVTVSVDYETLEKTDDYHPKSYGVKRNAELATFTIRANTLEDLVSKLSAHAALIGDAVTE